MAHYTAVFALVLILLVVYTLEYQIASETNSLTDDAMNDNYVTRQKRQLENFDTDEITSQDEEEPGFWDKVIKVAIRLFNKFIEWLNTS